MECPKCGYKMDAFEQECPKCKRLESRRVTTTGKAPQEPTQARTQPTQKPPPILSASSHPRPADRNAAIAWAQSLCANPQSAVILDTETTGTGKTAEVVQIGIIDLHGNVLLDTLVRPERRKRMPSDATAIHGITMDMLDTAPTFRELLPTVQTLTRGKTIVAYNAEFDERLLEQTAKQNATEPLDGRWHCAMVEYARFVGEVNSHTGEYRWHKLPAAVHGAVGDCQATLQLIREMASAAPAPAAKSTGCGSSVLIALILLAAAALFFILTN